MKILVDINHPAHVHYFKHAIKNLEGEGHQFLVVSRNKEIEHYLLKQYQIPFKSRGAGSNSVLGKVLYFFKAIIQLFFIIRKFNPKVVISFGTPYPAIASFLQNIDHISFTDTEHAKLHHLLTDRFSKYVVTPKSYRDNLGSKQIRFDGFFEMAYLHPNYFKPDKGILSFLNVKPGEQYIILRFISWNAIHDVGASGLTYNRKLKLVEELSKLAKVFISSEAELPEELKQYQIEFPVEKIHDALAFASLYIGEGGTTATECACLGTPNILINSLLHKDTIPGVHIELQKHELQFLFEKYEGRVLTLAKSALSDPKIVKKYKKNHGLMMSENSDVTQFLIKILAGYPDSIKAMQKGRYEIV